MNYKKAFVQAQSTYHGQMMRQHLAQHQHLELSQEGWQGLVTLTATRVQSWAQMGRRTFPHVHQLGFWNQSIHALWHCLGSSVTLHEKGCGLVVSTLHG